MNIAALLIAFVLFAVVVAGALRTVWFLKVLDDQTRNAYIVIALASAGIFAWASGRPVDLDIAGLKVAVGELRSQVDPVSKQMEAFYAIKKTEFFNRTNWERVRLVTKTSEGVVLEVTLEQEPIPGSVQVYEGVLLMPEYKYMFDKSNGRIVSFPANTDQPVVGLRILYYPRVR